MTEEEVLEEVRSVFKEAMENDSTQTWLNAPGKEMAECLAELLTTPCCAATGVLGNIGVLPWKDDNASIPVIKS